VGYPEDELSPHDGDVAELYEFIGPLLAHRYTSGDTEVVHLGNRYVPVADLSNSGPGASSSADAAAMLVNLPVNTTVVMAHGLGVPPRSLQLRLYRRQARSGEYRVWWQGDVIAITPKGSRAELRSVSQLGERLSTNIPSVSVQKQCNHFLGDPRCGVNLETFASNTHVSNASGLTVTVASVASGNAYWYRGGKIVRLSDNEERDIIDQVGATPVFRLNAPFGVLANGDSVRIYPGCDHYIQTCQGKYGNKENFGGHPAVPKSNPFVTILNVIAP
jgi:hypothetical protein